MQQDHVSGCEFAAAGHDGKEMAKCEVNHDKAVIEMHGGQMGAKQKTDSSVLTTPQVSFVVSYIVIILCGSTSKMRSVINLRRVAVYLVA